MESAFVGGEPATHLLTLNNPARPAFEPTIKRIGCTNAAE
jgi:hypothetical protein